MDPQYNGTAIARAQNVIVVAVNYRLGLLGFSAFNSSVKSSVSTNNGFRDQMASCEWVRRHILAFGGDSTKITIYGESAGGQGVAALLTSPLSRGLFQGAIAESPGATNTVTLRERVAHTAAMLSHTTCNAGDIECLQGLNYTELIGVIDGNTDSAEGNHWAGMTVGDDVSPDTTLNLVRAGSFNRVPFMIGTNSNEGALFIQTNSLSPAQAECVYRSLGDTTNTTIAEVLKGLYPIVPGQDNLYALIDLYSDIAMHCPIRELALALDEAGVSPWLYSFRRKPACPLQPVLGAAHGFEVPYVFHTLGNGPSCRSTADDQDLATQMGSLWAFFAREGGQVPTWPRFEARTKGQVAKLDLGLDPEDIDTEAGYRSEYCARLDPLGIPAFGRTSVQLNDAVARCMHAK